MDNTFWYKQDPSKPLFPDVLWSRPMNRAHSGKLLIAGGNLHSFSEVSQTFAATEKTGIGFTKLLLPDSLHKIIGSALPDTEFAPSTPIGSFGQKALDSLLDLSDWADAALLAGNFGHNSETSTMLEKFALQYKGNLTVAGDVTDIFLSNPGLLSRENTLLVIRPSQLRKLGTITKNKKAFTSSLGLVQFVNALHDFSSKFSVYIVTSCQDCTVIAAQGRISTTPQSSPVNWEDLAARTTVWWLQNKSQPFESMTSSLII